MSQTNVLPRSRGELGLRTVLRAIGVVAIAAGARGLLIGAREVPDPGSPTASVDSEYRFYAAWYPVLGAVVLNHARQPEVGRWIIRVVASGFGLAALGRLLSIRAHGRPHPTQSVLLVIEAVLAATLPAWHRRVFP